MRIASVLTPFNDKNLQLAAQTGVTDITVRYPGPGIHALRQYQEKAGEFNLQICAVEGELPIENIKYGNNKTDQEIEEIGDLIENMGRIGIPLLCYNFMAGTDWVRTKLDTKDRGGALVTGFDIDDVSSAVSLSNQDVINEPITAEDLWKNLEYFLKKILPVAEKTGVILAMHPDDPPVSSLQGKARIMNSVENFQKLISLVPSESNAICFCQGSFAEMGANIPTAIQMLGSHIRYVHFRDIRGTAEHFVETFQDNGQTDMYKAICAYRDIGFHGPMRPDHVPQLVGEEDGIPGYTMLGRLFAFGYMRGLIEASQADSENE